MVQANELRLGNYVIDTVTNTCGKIKGISSLDNDIYEGIPLTPEILEKCGFEYKHLPPKEHYFSNGMVVIDTYKTKDAFYYNGHFCDVSLDYVHQLQNLYFALTGKELEISL